MNNNLGLSPEKMSQLLGMASKQLGTDPESLKEQLESGKLDGLMKNMDPKMGNQLNGLLNNPKAAEAMLQNKQVQAALAKFLNK